MNNFLISGLIRNKIFYFNNILNCETTNLLLIYRILFLYNIVAHMTMENLLKNKN